MRMAQKSRAKQRYAEVPNRTAEEMSSTAKEKNSGA